MSERQLSAPSALTVTVEYATGEVTATAGDDYVTTAGKLTFGAGQTRKSIAVPVLGDLLVEPSESFSVVLANAQNGGILRAEAFGSITDDDDAPSDNLIRNHSAEMLPRAGEMPFWIEIEGTEWTRGTKSPTPHSGGAFFDPGNVAVGEIVQDVDVTPFAELVDLGVQRFLFEGFVRSSNESLPDEARIIIEYRDGAGQVLESFDSGTPGIVGIWEQIVDLHTAPVGTRTIRVRLLATRASGTGNDAAFDSLALRSLGTPILSVGDAAVAEGDDVAVDLVLPVSLNKAAENTVRFDFATVDATALAGVDYEARSGTIELLPGETAAEIRVPVAGDRMLELEEFFRVALTGFAGKAVLLDEEARGLIHDGDNVGGSVRELRTFWLGDLRIFAWTDNTEITLIDIQTNQPLKITDSRISSKNVTSNPFVLENAGDSFEGVGNNVQLRVVAADATGAGQIRPITVWTGSLEPTSRHPDLAPEDEDP